MQVDHQIFFSLCSASFFMDPLAVLKMNLNPAAKMDKFLFFSKPNPG
jgi:hypothetical protein